MFHTSQICSLTLCGYIVFSFYLYELLFIAQSLAPFECSASPWLSVLKILSFHDELYFYTALHAISFICLASDNQSQCQNLKQVYRVASKTLWPLTSFAAVSNRHTILPKANRWHRFLLFFWTKGKRWTYYSRLKGGQDCIFLDSFIEGQVNLNSWQKAYCSFSHDEFSDYYRTRWAFSCK